MNPKKQYYENAANSLIKKLNLRGMDGYYIDNRTEALTKIKDFLTPHCSISFGGSMTLEEIGLLDELKNSDYLIYDRKEAKTPEEKRQLYGKIVMCDYYFMSSNAITLDGELINIDGVGNRVACLCYGPKYVFVVAGMNKIVPDLASGIARVRNMAAPPNTVRLNRATPCATLGRCSDCLSNDCICCETVITRKSMIPGRIKVILIGEELGY